MSKTTLFYDGACPLCADFACGLEGPLTIVDGRRAVETRRALGLDLESGMVVRHDGRILQGADALVLLARLATHRAWHQRVLLRLARSPRTARRVYPWLQRVRSLLLRLSGRPRITP